MQRMRSLRAVVTEGPKRAAKVCLLLLLAVGPLTAVSGPAHASTTWNIGDVFAGVAGGNYNVYDNAGNFKETISTGLGGFTTGCSFNPALDKLYTTAFSGSSVVVFNNASPHGIAQTINTPKPSEESVVFAANGHFFVGGPSNPAIVEYDATGTLVDSDTVANDGTGGPDWIDLAADQKTMFYASEGRLIKRYDVAADLQLADFATLPGSGNAFALRLLPPGDGTGGLIVADRSNVKRLDGSGAVAQTYDATGEDSWFSLNLDPNGTSFWAGDFGTNRFYRFNIATGAVEVGPIASGGSLFGLCVKGELTAAIPEITLAPPTAENNVGSPHTVTATIASGGTAVVGELVTFTVTDGPNTGASGACVPADCKTDSSGQVSFTYTGTGGIGTDTIQACFSDDLGNSHCATATKTWVNNPPVCTAAAASPSLLWPPNHKLRVVEVVGVTDPDGDPVTIVITGVTQDEPLNGLGDGDTSPDAAAGPSPSSVQLRAERSGKGDGRVYRISFTATDSKGASCSGTVLVGVPHDQGAGSTPIDSGLVVNSFGP